MIPEAEPRDTGTLVIYDLRDPAQWERARADRLAWGRESTELFDLDLDHIAIVFRRPGELEASA